MKKFIPNILSCLRIPLSFVILLFAGTPCVLITAYCLCAVTDLLDGFLARRWRVESAAGAKIDSIADLTCFGAAAVITFWITPIAADKLFVTVVIAVTVVRLFNIVLTKLKYRQWGILHTLGNKATGMIVFLLWPVCVLLGYVPPWCTALAGGIALLSSLEESVILFLRKVYNPNIKSLYCKDS